MKTIRKRLGYFVKAVFSDQAPPSPVEKGANQQRTASTFSQADVESVRPFFDVDFYCSQNPDVAKSGHDPIEHYLMWGWQERRDPSRDFSTHYYLEAYPDILQNRLNPLVHYAIAGRKEGRRAKPNGPLAVAYSQDAKPVQGYLSAIASLKEYKGKPAVHGKPEAGRLDIHWVIPDFSRGGGGHMTIFRMVHLLETLGHKCTIWVFIGDLHKQPSDVYDDIVKYFQCVGAEIKITNDGVIDAAGDALIATSWNTVYPVAAAEKFRQKFYFVQDHEPEFYPTGSDSLLARESYSFDLACICAGDWLKGLMSRRYGRWARSFDLAYDHEVYKIKASKPFGDGKRTKIAVYAREATSRRCVNLALVALDMLGRERDDFEVHFYGQERLPFNEVNYPAWNHGVLDSAALADLYNVCDIGICFSATNYSLVPQEMMACGLPLIELDGESTRAVFPEGIVSLAGPQPESIKNKINELIASPEERRRQAAKAFEWVGALTWEKSARAVEAAILERLDLAKAPNVVRSPEKLLDVVIPTYNGIGEIEKVVEALRSQSLYPQMAIYCVDSSSRDGTAEWLAAQKDIKTTTIPQREFQHGRTRNFGASLGNSPNIAFLTQDAIPATSYWASDICQMMDHFPSAAGLFGRHLPYPEHPRHIRDEINKHFDEMLRFPLLLSKDTDPAKWASGDIGWRQVLHYYSDNNSCMRRTVWQEMPYPEVDFGEDQIWAKAIIEAGYSKIYAPTATVYHSHDFGPKDTYERSATESRFFYQFFGYELAPSSEIELSKIVENEQLAFRKAAALYNLDKEETNLRNAIIAEKYRGWFDGMSAAKRLMGKDH